MKSRTWAAWAVLVCLASAADAAAAGFNADRSAMTFDSLDMDKIAREDTLADVKQGRYRFAIAHDVKIDPATAGLRQVKSDGSTLWRFEVATPDAAHLNFGFNPFRLPPGAVLTIRSRDGKQAIGPFTDRNNSRTGQFWTPVLPAPDAVVELAVPAGAESQVQLRLVRVGHGYRGFGSEAKHCKSGACNMDVACLDTTDPWNMQRRSAGTYTVEGTDTCSGSLVNNTRYDRRMLFATAAHCEVNDDEAAAGVVVYWNYESPTCRAPGSTASGTPLPLPNTTQSGATFVAATLNPFVSVPPTALHSDFTLIELDGEPDPAWNLYWSGWDSRDLASHVCAAPADAASTDGLCASIHHPRVQEKRISFVEANLGQVDYQAGVASHFHAYWDPTPPILAGIQPPPASVEPNVTEPGSSGSPLYNAQHRLVGVLSGGPSQCGASGENLSDYYGRLASAWDGGGTAATAARTHLDPLGAGTTRTLDGVGTCTDVAAPAQLVASASGANAVALAWDAAAGATKYRVYRAIGACPAAGYARLADIDNATTYADAAVSGGSVYSYRVAAVDPARHCESALTDCASATATGLCTLAPTFDGAASAASAGTPSCAIDVAWQAATGHCSGQTRYNVFRSATPGFTPSPANAVATCLTGGTYRDATAAPDTAYHYVVRAEDIGASGDGVCAAGAQDANVTEQNATAAGANTIIFVDNAESGPAAWAVSGTGGGADFAIVGTQSHSATQAWYVPLPDETSSRVLAGAAPVMVPSTPGVLFEAWIRYASEARYDGVVLEYSLDGGTTWADILAAQGAVPADANRFLMGGYDAVMASNGAFGARAAWHGSSGGQWRRVAVDLAAFAGTSTTFRFRAGSDGSVGGAGFWVDDIRVHAGTACTVSDNDAIFDDGFDP